MSSLAGALDGYTQPRHPKMQYNPISEDVEMTASKNEPEGLEDDEEIEELLDERLIKIRAISSVTELMLPLAGPFPFPFPFVFHDDLGPG